MKRPKNFIETDTKTFFRDQNFRDRDRYSQKIEKSLDTEKSLDEMSHSGHERNEEHLVKLEYREEREATEADLINIIINY